MDRDVTQDQRYLLDASARFIEQTYPLERVREKPFRDADWAADYRRRAAELGWFSMLVPDEFGGGSVSGNGAVDATLVAYLRGGMLQPGAFVATNVVAHALSVAGNEEQREKVLAALMSGEQSAAWAVGAPAVHGPVGGTVQAKATGSGYELTGSTSFMVDADTASWLLVTAEVEDGVSQFLLPAGLPGVSVTSLESLDITRAFTEVRFDRVQVSASDVVGEPGRAAEPAARQLAIGCVLTAAESVGAMDHDFSMAVQYAKDRIAFGRPIGSFQAIKHLLADTSLLLEMSKAVTLSAAENLGTDDGYALESASIAKAFVGEHGVDLAQNCFQVFGGIGFTWEHNQHLYLRRLTTDAALYGDPAWHRERLCRLSGL
ncbi:acyl-CoA dehydrogenase family protein [Acrocarpospora macrocephala]|uniref:Acyl-CoA dehydrogenase n=1 Tax=Acrocarpospora macrocephala TaxID=150177 RepID=A0A5M3WLL2_9ACTN|nr:acyl-CoA dehydrogenase family protein [Acrocarpospora macrocephala]GES09380.1 acyl-CoA dehydrogenase [Acrocarpospora macrocephala]